MVTEDYENLYNTTYERWTHALQNCQSLHNSANRFYKMYYSWEHRKDYGYNDNYDPAIGYRNIETARAYLRCNVLEPGLSAASEEDNDKAAVMNGVIKADYATSDIQKAMDKWYLNMLITGTGALKLGWSFEEKSFWRWVKDDEELVSLANEALQVMQAKAPEEEITKQFALIVESGQLDLLKKFIATGVIPNIKPENAFTGFKVRDMAQADRPCFEVVPIQDLAWLGTGENIRRCDCVFRRFYVTRPQIQAWQAQGGDWINLDKVLDTCSEDYGQESSSSQLIDMANGRTIRPGMMIPLIEETRRDPKTGEIWETIINIQSSSVVRHRRMPYFHNEFPYFTIRLFGSTSDFAGISMLAPIESSIGEYIKTYNEILENGQLAINKVFLTRFAGGNAKPQLHFFPGNLIASEGYDDIRPLDIPDIRPASLELLDRIRSEIEEITGCPASMSAAHGDQSGNNAGAIEQFQFFQTARFAATQHQIAVELSALTLQMVRLHQQYDFEGRTIYIEDGKKGDRWVYYKPSEYAGQFIANSDPRSMLPTNNAVKRAQLLSAYNMISTAQVATIDPKTNQPVRRLIFNPVQLVKEIVGTFDLLDNRNLFNHDGDITGVDPAALPPVPQPTQEQAEQANAETSEEAIPPETMEKLKAYAEATGRPLEKVIEEAQAVLEQGKAEANAPMEIQGGAELPPELAAGMGGGEENIMTREGANGANTATGTSGTPPIKGGPQQHGISPQQVGNPETLAAASQSAYSLQ